MLNGGIVSPRFQNRYSKLQPNLFRTQSRNEPNFLKVSPESEFLSKVHSNLDLNLFSVTAPPPRTDIWTRDDSAENTGEYIDDLHSNMHSPASGRSSSRYSPMSSHVTQPTPRHSPSTPSIHRLVIGDDPDDEGRFTYESAQATITSSISADPRMSPEHGQKENIVRTKSEGTVSETDQHSHKEKWGFRRVNQQGKSAACVVS